MSSSVQLSTSLEADGVAPRSGIDAHSNREHAAVGRDVVAALVCRRAASRRANRDRRCGAERHRRLCLDVHNRKTACCWSVIQLQALRTPHRVKVATVLRELIHRLGWRVRLDVDTPVRCQTILGVSFELYATPRPSGENVANQLRRISDEDKLLADKLVVDAAGGCGSATLKARSEEFGRGHRRSRGRDRPS